MKYNFLKCFYKPELANTFQLLCVFSDIQTNIDKTICYFLVW